MSDRPRNGALAAMYERWAAIEREYGQPLREVILAYRQDGNPWPVIAGALGCTDGTLRDWRRRLGLPLDLHDKAFNDTSWEGRRREADRRASAMGYASMREAVISLRYHGLTWRQIAGRLGVSLATVRKYRPPALAWEWITPAEERRRRAERARAFNEARGRQPANHPWRQDEGAHYAACRARLPNPSEVPERHGSGA